MPPSFFSFAARTQTKTNLIKLAPELGEVLCPPGTLLFSGVFLRACGASATVDSLFEGHALTSRLGLHLSAPYLMVSARKFGCGNR